MFYHGVINHVPRLPLLHGAALLDKENPERVLYRSKPYLLAPAAPLRVRGRRSARGVPLRIHTGRRPRGHILRRSRHLRRPRIRPHLRDHKPSERKPSLTITTMRNLLRSLAAAVIPASSILQLAAATLPGGKELHGLREPFHRHHQFRDHQPWCRHAQRPDVCRPFNVMGSELNRYDKDSRWWSTPYDNTNSFLTGFSHVNLSGVGCPEMGSLLLMPTSGKLNVDYHGYGTAYSDEKASPGALCRPARQIRHPGRGHGDKTRRGEPIHIPRRRGKRLPEPRRGADQRVRRDREARVGDRV